MAVRTDLNGIKDELISLFTTANTVGASPVDLSDGLNKRIQKVLGVRPDLLPIQASFYPCVTCYIDAKEVTGSDIARDQLSAKRQAEVRFDIVGIISDSKITDKTRDLASDDINRLMENIELILRSSPNLNGKVLWQAPQTCQYFAGSLDSQTQVRAGILSVKARVYY